jgi:hypothetical protein
MDTARVDTRQLLTIDEFRMRNGGMCRETVYQLIRRGELRAVKNGARTLIFSDAEEAWRSSLPELKLPSPA